MPPEGQLEVVGVNWEAGATAFTERATVNAFSGITSQTATRVDADITRGAVRTSSGGFQPNNGPAPEVPPAFNQRFRDYESRPLGAPPINIGYPTGPAVDFDRELLQFTGKIRSNAPKYLFAQNGEVSSGGDGSSTSVLSVGAIDISLGLVAGGNDEVTANLDIPAPLAFDASLQIFWGVSTIVEILLIDVVPPVTGKGPPTVQILDSRTISRSRNADGGDVVGGNVHLVIDVRKKVIATYSEF